MPASYVKRATATSHPDIEDRGDKVKNRVRGDTVTYYEYALDLVEPAGYSAKQLLLSAAAEPIREVSR
jgi:hypothetical protein